MPAPKPEVTRAVIAALAHDAEVMQELVALAEKRRASIEIAKYLMAYKIEIVRQIHLLEAAR